jgi:hypothetical protein
MAAGVSAHVARTVGARHSSQVRVVAGPRIVDQVSPHLAGSVGDAGPPGIDADHQIWMRLPDRCDKGHHPVQLFRDADLWPGARFDPADVDSVSAFGHCPGHRFECHRVVDIPACVIEGVRGSVDDCQEAGLPWCEGPVSQSEVATMGDMTGHDTIVS